MTAISDLRICDRCGNAFARILKKETVNRCPACYVWKKEVEI